MSKTDWLIWTMLIGLPVVCGWLGVLAWQAQRVAARGLAAVSNLNDRLSATERRLALNARQAAEQAGRVAWLEARVRPVKAVGTARAVIPSQPQRESMTERRHRVLALARRGMEPELIAEKLGLPHGEIELILSLNAVAA